MNGSLCALRIESFVSDLTRRDNVSECSQGSVWLRAGSCPRGLFRFDRRGVSVDAGAVTDLVADAHPDANAVAHPDAHPDADTNSDAVAHPDADTNSDTNTDAHPDTDACATAWGDDIR